MSFACTVAHPFVVEIKWRYLKYVAIDARLQVDGLLLW